MGVPIVLFDSTVKALQNRYQEPGDDPFPVPQDERQEIVHQLWQLRVTVAGWWTMETDYLRDLLQKYIEVQSAEAVVLEKLAILKAKERRNGPRQEQIVERIKEVRAYNQAHREGRKTQYLGAGTQPL